MFHLKPSEVVFIIIIVNFVWSLFAYMTETITPYNANINKIVEILSARLNIPLQR
jgi:hypothetical protein